MNRSSRRSFLASASALAGVSLLPNIVEAAQAPQGGWDLSFVDKLNGKHKQVFDIMDTSVGLVVVQPSRVIVCPALLMTTSVCLSLLYPMRFSS